MKKTSKKLSLTTTTIRDLTGNDLTQVVGGSISVYNPSGGITSLNPSGGITSLNPSGGRH